MWTIDCRESGRRSLSLPPCRNHNGEIAMKTVLITGCSSGYGLETAGHFHSRSWRVIATMRTPRADVLPRWEELARVPARCDQPRKHRKRARAERADRRTRQQCGHRSLRSIRSDADADYARSVRDKYVWRDGDDAGAVAAISRSQSGRRRQRDVQCDVSADALGSGVHGEQDSDRRIYRVARIRARAV